MILHTGPNRFSNGRMGEKQNQAKGPFPRAHRLPLELISVSTKKFIGHDARRRDANYLSCGSSRERAGVQPKSIPARKRASARRRAVTS
jgi:hypothetical protein